MAQAVPDDVRGVIETDLSDSDIDNFITDAEFDAKNAINDYTNTLDPTERSQLEKYLAALYIRQTKDKAISSTSRETASVSYEMPTISWLKDKVDERDPSGQLAYSKDTDRYVTKTG